jgi:hypothetical protein
MAATVPILGCAWRVCGTFAPAVTSLRDTADPFEDGQVTILPARFMLAAAHPSMGNVAVLSRARRPLHQRCSRRVGGLPDVFLPKLIVVC